MLPLQTLGPHPRWCYFLHGFLEKSANVTQSQALGIEKDIEFGSDNLEVLSDKEYNECLQLKETQQASSASIALVSTSIACLSNSSSDRS